MESSFVSGLGGDPLPSLGARVPLELFFTETIGNDQKPGSILSSPEAKTKYNGKKMIFFSTVLKAQLLKIGSEGCFVFVLLLFFVFALLLFCFLFLFFGVWFSMEGEWESLPVLLEKRELMVSGIQQALNKNALDG